MYINLKSVIAALGAALLVGCGGGGGGGGSPPAALLLITPSNYADVGTGSVAGVNGASDAAGSGTTSLVGAQISQSGSFGLKGVALTTATTVLNNWAVFNTPTIVGAVTQTSVSCTGGGTLSASANDADDSNTATAGDSVSGTFTNCVENGFVLNGSMSISINSFSGDLSTVGAASLTMTFNNFRSGSDPVNGSLTLSVNRSSATSLTATLSMPSLTVTSAGNTWTYTSFSLTASETGSSGTLQIAGNVSSSIYGGSVDVSTPTTITIDSSNNVTGTILMAGKNGTKVRMVGQGTTTILIEADTTGNGTYDTNSTVTVASLGL